MSETTTLHIEELRATIESLTTAGEDLLKRGAEKDNKIHALLTEGAALKKKIEDPTWADFVEITRGWLTKYPPDIFTGVSGDSGPLFVVAIRGALSELDSASDSHVTKPQTQSVRDTDDQKQCQHEYSPSYLAGTRCSNCGKPKPYTVAA